MRQTSDPHEVTEQSDPLYYLRASWRATVRILALSQMKCGHQKVLKNRVTSYDLNLDGRIHRRGTNSEAGKEYWQSGERSKTQLSISSLPASGFALVQSNI